MLANNLLFWPGNGTGSSVQISVSKLKTSYGTANEKRGRRVLVVGNRGFFRAIKCCLRPRIETRQFTNTPCVSIEALINTPKPQLVIINYEDIQDEATEALDALVRRFPCLPLILVSPKSVNAVLTKMATVIADLSEVPGQLAKLNL